LALSSSKVNYTAAFDTDDSIVNPESLILGYDPVPYGSEEVSIGVQESGWDAVSGFWQISNQSLQAGNSVSSTNGMILSHLFSVEPRSSFSVRPVDPALGSPNYAGFVHSYEDSEHYKTAEILFNVDGFIYILTRTVNGTSWVNGFTSPSWPGLNTGITWDTDEWYDFEILVETDSTTFSINCTPVLTEPGINPVGNIGVFYSRFYTVNLANVSFSSSSRWELRPSETHIFEFPEDFDEWSIIDGLWSAENESLVAGDIDGPTKGLILSPLELGLASIGFRLSSLDRTPDIPNYVGIIHSYVDERHFKMIELQFNTDGYLYALSRTVDGTTWDQGATFPPWPGYRTNISWTNGTVFDVEAQLLEESLILSLNGSQVFSLEAENSMGRIGFFYSRFNHVSFSNVTISGMREWTSPDYSNAQFTSSNLPSLEIISGNWYAANNALVSASADASTPHTILGYQDYRLSIQTLFLVL